MEQGTYFNFQQLVIGGMTGGCWSWDIPSKIQFSAHSWRNMFFLCDKDITSTMMMPVFWRVSIFTCFMWPPSIAWHIWLVAGEVLFFFLKKLILDTNLSKVLHCIEPGLAYVSKTKTSLFLELYPDSHESRQKSFIIRGGGGIPRGSTPRQGIVFDLSVLNRVYNFV